MTDREFFIETLGDELPRFDKVFKALPQDKLDYKPHEKSRSAMETVNSCAIEAATIPIFLETGKLDFSGLPPEAIPHSFDEALTLFTKNFEAAKSKAASMSEEDWSGEAKMMQGETEAWKTTKGRMAWSFLLDMIHHRGQLSAYLRPMGGKVPSIYGPSGDSQE